MSSKGQRRAVGRRSDGLTFDPRKAGNNIAGRTDHVFTDDCPVEVSYEVTFEPEHTGVSDEDDDAASWVSSENDNSIAFLDADLEQEQVKEDIRETSESEEEEDDILGLNLFDAKDQEWTSGYVIKDIGPKRQRSSLSRSSNSDSSNYPTPPVPPPDAHVFIGMFRTLFFDHHQI